eukprot:2255596-Rhodomonas_salina.1
MSRRKNTSATPSAVSTVPACSQSTNASRKLRASNRHSHGLDRRWDGGWGGFWEEGLSLIHISEPTRPRLI